MFSFFSLIRKGRDLMVRGENYRTVYVSISGYAWNRLIFNGMDTLVVVLVLWARKDSSK